MIINRIDGCCSAFTIKYNPNFKYLNKKSFTEGLIEAINIYNSKNEEKIDLESVKTVIIMSNDRYYFKFWFKKGFSYSGDMMKVYVYHVDYNNSLLYYKIKNNIN